MLTIEAEAETLELTATRPFPIDVNSVQEDDAGAG